MAEMVYGETLRLPGQIFRIFKTATIQDLRRHFNQIWQTATSFIMPRHLSNCAYVFVRHDAMRKTLQRPYDGPFQGIKRDKKHFVLRIPGKNVTIVIDLLKPAFGVNEGIDTP